MDRQFAAATADRTGDRHSIADALAKRRRVIRVGARAESSRSRRCGLSSSGAALRRLLKCFGAAAQASIVNKSVANNTSPSKCALAAAIHCGDGHRRTQQVTADPPPWRPTKLRFEVDAMR